MRSIIVGAGPTGLYTAIALARRGHQVTVIDRDPGPDGAGWDRKGVMQFHHPHFFRQQVAEALQAEMPEVWDGLLAAGAVPATLPGQPGVPAGLHCRRLTFERVLREAARAEPGVRLCTGHVDAVCGERGRVRGVRVGGRRVDADLVIDAGGRAGRLTRALRGPAAGGDCGIAYVSRQYQLRPGAAAGPVNMPFGVMVTYPGYLAAVFIHDNRIISALIARASADRPLAALRTRAAFEAAARAIPALAAWTDPARARPITPVLPGGRLYNSYRGQLDDAGRVALDGLIYAGDAVCTTNPAAGRGVTTSLLQARQLLALLVGHRRDLTSCSLAFEAWCASHIRPWFEDHVYWDADLIRRWSGQDVDLTRPLPPDLIIAAGQADPEVARAAGPYQAMLAPPASLDAVQARARDIYATGWRPPAPPGPTRDELARLVTAAASSRSHPAVKAALPGDVTGALQKDRRRSQIRRRPRGSPCTPPRHAVTGTGGRFGRVRVLAVGFVLGGWGVGPVGGFGWAGAVQIAEAIRGRQVSAAEVLAEQLERIARLDAELGSVVTLDAEGARGRAAEADAALARGEVWGPLHGVGVTIEDIHATAGMRSTFGGYRPFADHVPAVDATVAARLKAAGAIVVGKTNGPCLWGEDSVFDPTRNPWNRARTAGGSSTGPAVAVAAGLTPLDIAADTGGSIQCPAAFCGVFGMRPTEHRVPLTGTLFIDPVRKFRVLTTAGPMARSVADLRLALQLIAGPDGRDPEVPPVPWRDAGPAGLPGLRVAYAPGYPPSADAEVRAGIEALAAELDKLGAIIQDRLPGPELAGQGRLVDELFAMLAFAEPPPAAGSDEPGSRPLWDYLVALDRRDEFMADWDRFFAGCDVLLAPAMPVCAWPADDEPADDSPQAHALASLMLSQVSGCPTVVIPAGTDSNGVPFGAQLIGPRWQDERLLAIAEAVTAAAGGFRPPPGL